MFIILVHGNCIPGQEASKRFSSHRKNSAGGTCLTVAEEQLLQRTTAKSPGFEFACDLVASDLWCD